MFKTLSVVLLSAQLLAGPVVFSAVAGPAVASSAALPAHAGLDRSPIPMDGLHGKYPGTAVRIHLAAAVSVVPGRPRRSQWLS
jgi:hypothetical protein